VSTTSGPETALARPVATTVLAHGTVLSMEEGAGVIRDGAVAFAGDAIVAVGDAAAVLAAHPDAEVIDCTGCAVMPGLVNGHTHVPMTLLRGIADDLRLDVWLVGYVMPVERHFVTPDFVRLGTQLGCAEMIRSGVTTFVDMYYFEDDVARATAEVGMRAVVAQTILVFPAPDAASWEDSLERARRLIEEFKGHPLIVPAVGPHAHYTCPPEILRAAAALALEHDVPLHTHVSETATEVEDARRNYGRPVVPWLKKHGLLATKLIAAHCVHIDEGEIRALAKAGAGAMHNPSSNLKIASGFAPVAKMLEAGLLVGIGTDGAASNNDLDMFEEIRLAAFVAKAVANDPLALPARQALHMATLGGARAAHIGDITGSLTPGKRADIAVVDLTGLHDTPRFGRDADAVYSQLVYACKSTDVRDVWCNGRPLMRGRRLLTVDTEAVAREAQQVAERIDAFLVAREGSVLDKLLVLGGLAEEESFEVQVKVAVDDPEAIERRLRRRDLRVLRSSRRRQFDTYYLFDDPEHDRVRYREDEILDASGRAREVRYSLTLTGPAKEREFEHSVLLSRSRFSAIADRSKRFYREYFRPAEEREVVKERRRWHIRYGEEEFAVNLDRLPLPERTEWFLEIKARTWSPRDAETKARLIGELVDLLGADATRVTRTEYVDL
jgi:5-methylthioadenosine/S-adenosylhomocysteine deaminase